ncbi:MAG: hypothetical protein A4E62_00751 [Syntrophorhabdus sp. PtaU1.Bin002]|nr:MAG: hypothetical protein A4E58_00651 [Syntrophorhabdus sp. PtaB.Bin006]OPY72759.1 MAG: hypothetical protein A4E62_00751 [Syntrophorhabdus sp. PtaU1.Bin002]
MTEKGTSDTGQECIRLGSWSEDQLNRLMGEAARIKDTGERIDFLSRQFLGVGYRENTLIGNAETAEAFVVNFEGVDCFTFIDYVEVMRCSRSFAGFVNNLRRIRYRSGNVTFTERNHFFTDWREFNHGLVEDVTAQIGGVKTKTIRKLLNVKADGTPYLPGIPPRERTIGYVPSYVIDDGIVAKLKTGDYIGMYSELPGLDVSHVGILVNHSGRIHLRHASSLAGRRKVCDQDFVSYVADKPGIVVLRPFG